MRSWRGRAALRGRIHGRLLLALIVIAALACIAALLQFSVLRDGDAADRTGIDAEIPTAPDFRAASDSATAETTDTPSPTAEADASSPEPATTEAATTEAATTESAPVALQCTASLSVKDEWGRSVSIEVLVANTGTEPIDGWEVEIAVKHLSVSSTWGLDHIEDDRYGDTWLNGSIEPGASVAPSFTAKVGGEYDLPETVPCTPSE